MKSCSSKNLPEKKQLHPTLFAFDITECRHFSMLCQDSDMSMHETDKNRLV